MLTKWLERHLGFKMFYFFAEDGEAGGGAGGPGSLGEGDEVSDDQLDDDGWVAKRGAKNVREELSRRQETEKTLKAERDALNAELEKLRKPQPKPEGDDKPKGKWRPPHLENLMKKWTDKKVDPEFLADLVDGILETATGASRDISKHILDERFKDSELDDVVNDRRAVHLDKSLEKLKEKPNLKMVIERYGDEIKALAGKELDKKLWKNPDNVEYVVGKVLASHLSDFGIDETPEKKTTIPKLNETGNHPASQGGISVSDDDIAQAAFEADLNVDDPAGRKAAIKIAQLKKLRDQAREKSLAGE